jgi:hypothetical protein
MTADDHYSHTKNPDVVDKAMEHTVLPLAVSQHIPRTKCSHWILVP